MKRAIGVCDLGEHVKKKGYALLQYGLNVNGGAFCALGPLHSISNDQMEKKGLTLVLEHLRYCPLIDPKKLDLEQKVSNEELLKVKRNHVIVAITLFEGDFIEITPLHGGRGWQFSGHEDEAFRLQLPATNQRFLELLVKAFEIAS